MKRFLFIVFIAGLAWGQETQSNTSARNPVFGVANNVRQVASLPATCRTGVNAEIIYLTGTSAGLYVCTAVNTWTAAGAGSIESGTSLPDTCTDGELFIKKDAVDGQQIYACINSAWVQQGVAAGGGITSINTDVSSAQTIVTGTGGADFAIATKSGETVISLPTAASNKRGVITSALFDDFNARVKGGASLTTAGRLAKVSAAGTITEDADVTTTAGVVTAKGFVGDVTGNASTATNALTAAAVVGDETVVVGAGGARGVASSTLDATVAKMTKGVPSAATAGTDYVAPGATTTFSAAQTFQGGLVASGASGTVNLSGALSTRVTKTGTTLPATCVVGETFFKTNAVAGSNQFGCTATDTWTLMGGGSGDMVGPVSSTDDHFATYDGTTGKVLKDTLALATVFTSPGSDAEVPSTKAVVDYASAIGGGDVLASGTFNTGEPMFGSGTASKTIVAGSRSGDTTTLVSMASGDGKTANAPLAWTAAGNAATASNPIGAAYGGTGSAFFTVSGPASTAKTYTFPNANSTVAALGTAQSWTANQMFGSGNFLLGGSSSGTTGIVPAAAASGTWTLPSVTDTFAGKATTDIFTNKTIDTAGPNTLKINGNTLSASAGTATVTIPNSTDTLMGKATSDIMTNKTFNTGGTGNVFQIAGTGITAVTGTGSVVLATSPSLTTPTIGEATATSVNKVAITAPGTSATLTILNGKTLTANNSLTLAGTDTTTMTFPGTSQTIPGINQVNTAGSSFTLNASAASATAGLLIPVAAGAAPTTNGAIAYNSTTNLPAFGANGSTLTPLFLTLAQTIAAAKTVGTGGSITFSGTGTVNANQINSTALSGLGTGILKNTTTTGIPSIAASTDVRSMWSGTCDSSTYLRGDGSCSTPAGAGDVIADTLTTATAVPKVGTSAKHITESGVTIDASNNLSVPGGIAAGVGSGKAGVLDLNQGTTPDTQAANTFRFRAPATIATAFSWTAPAADAAGAILSNGSGTLSILGTNGSGNLLRSAGTAAIASGKTATFNNTFNYSGLDGGTLGLAGNLTLSGAFNTILTVTGTTALTLPTSGTLTTNPMTGTGDLVYGGTAGAPTRLAAAGTASFPLLSGAAAAPTWSTIQYLTSGTSGGIPYLSSSTSLASSAALAQYGVVVGGGAGAAPATITAGAGGTLLQGVASAVPAFTATPTLGVAGSVVGSLAFLNATSGGITLTPVTGALGTAAIAIPAETGTLLTTATSAGSFPTLNQNTTGTALDISSTTPDWGGKTSFEIPNAAAPTVDAFGEIAGDNDLWASGRGAPVFYDGTAPVALIGALVSDAPSNGQVPKWNTGGTVTWENDNDSGGAPAFSAITAGTNTAALVIGTGGSLTISDTGTINATSLGGSAAALYAKLADPVFTSSVQIPNGTGPTVDAAGEIAVDTTSDQLQFYGGAKRAIPSIRSFSLVIVAPVATDDFPVFKAPYAMTILGIDGVLSGSTNVIGQLQECTTAGASCADLDSDITFDGGNDADDGTLTDSSIASGAWLAWKTTSVSGTPTALTVTVRYRAVPD